MRFVEIHGTRVHYLKAGRGPVVALVHSLGSSVHAWRGTVEALRDRYTLLAFDCRGHGHSSIGDGFTTAKVAADLRGLVETLGVEQFHLLGLSMGGLIALRFYSLWPERVRSLILSGSYAKAGEESRLRLAAAKAALKKISMRTWGEQYAAATLVPTTPRDVHAALADAIGRMDPSEYLQAYEAIVHEDITPILSRVAVPTLVLVGELDSRTPLPFSQRLAQGIPSSRLHVIPRAGHLANLDNPEGFHSVVRAFLEAQPRYRAALVP